jgi:mycoredoxin
MPIKVYGAGWCHMTTDTLAHLKQLGIAHEYIDVEKDKHAAAFVRAHSHGRERKPTLDIDGTILVEPDNDELDAALRNLNLLT